MVPQRNPTGSQPRNARAPPMQWEPPQQEKVAAIRQQAATLQAGQSMDLALKDGSVFRISPGPYGKGISIVPLGTVEAGAFRSAVRPSPVPGGPRGRKPRPSTLDLREKLNHDNNLKSGLKTPVEYVQWLQERDPEVGVPMARTIVYREMKPYR